MPKQYWIAATEKAHFLNDKRPSEGASEVRSGLATPPEAVGVKGTVSRQTGFYPTCLSSVHLGPKFGVARGWTNPSIKTVPLSKSSRCRALTTRSRCSRSSDCTPRSTHRPAGAIQVGRLSTRLTPWEKGVECAFRNLLITGREA